jgi:outer membrane scaffolding protein for murein synthesis (MipA/OmpV family)
MLVAVGVWHIACAAQGTTTSPSAGEAALLPRWELGVVGFGVSQQAYPGADEQVRGAVALPYLIYRGERLRVDRETVGLRALRTATYEFDVGFGAALGSNANDVAARRGMPDLGTLVEFGPRVKWRLGETPAGGRWHAELPWRAVIDITGGPKSRGFTLEPQLLARWGAGQPRWFTASVSTVLGTRKLADTFYGVSPAYADVDRPAYTARSGLIAWRLGLAGGGALGRDWSWFAFGRIDSVDGAANEASPLVRQRVGWTSGAGLTWTWMRSSEAAVD